MSEDAAIRVDHVTKTFRLPHEKQTSLKGALINKLRGGGRSYETQQVLKEVSFEIKRGEFFGIVGRNGSGKSTLLKILAGIYMPTGGHVQVNGRLTPFIELGVGFNPELTGRENVFLNGALLGFNRRDVAAMYDDIVEFAELEKFMDQKLKNYSSGMQVRLAFSIAIRARSDILLIDEVLAVGDASFQQKCYDYFYQLKRNKQTVVLVTHDMSAVRDFCDRAILIHDGHLKDEGSPVKVAREYLLLNLPKDQKVETGDQAYSGNGAMTIEQIRVTYPKSQKFFRPEDQVRVSLTLRVNQALKAPIIGLTVNDMAGREIFVTNTKALEIATGDYKSGDVIEAEFVMDNTFNDGDYLVTPATASSDTTKVYARWENAARFKVFGWSFPTGILQTPTEIKLRKKRSD
jgi:ABC-2 type transport system ATP-binding protein